EQAKSDFQFILYLVIGTIPVGVVGLLFGDVIGEAISNTKIFGFTLLITTVAIWMMRYLSGSNIDGVLTSRHAVIVVLANSDVVTLSIYRSGASSVELILV